LPLTSLRFLAFCIGLSIAIPAALLLLWRRAPRNSGWAIAVFLVGVLLAQFDYVAIRKHFKKLKPDWSLFSAVEEEHYPPYPFGHTPFFPVAALGKAVGFDNVWLKNDGLNPTASLKDRASFLVVAEANRIKEPSIVTASTGNAASAVPACSSVDDLHVSLVLSMPREY